MTAEYILNIPHYHGNRMWLAPVALTIGYIIYTPMDSFDLNCKSGRIIYLHFKPTDAVDLCIANS